MDEGIRAESFAADLEDFSVGGGGGVGWVVDSAGGNPRAFGVVELDADKAVFGHALPYGERVVLEAGVGEVVFYPRHVALDVGERDAAEIADFGVEFSEGFLRRG